MNIWEKCSHSLPFPPGRCLRLQGALGLGLHLAPQASGRTSLGPVSPPLSRLTQGVHGLQWGARLAHGTPQVGPLVRPGHTGWLLLQEVLPGPRQPVSDDLGT